MSCVFVAGTADEAGDDEVRAGGVEDRAGVGFGVREEPVGVGVDEDAVEVEVRCPPWESAIRILSEPSARRCS